MASQAATLTEELLAAAAANRSDLTTLVRAEVDTAIMTRLGLVPVQKFEEVQAEAARLRAENARLRSESSQAAAPKSAAKKAAAPKSAAKKAAAPRGTKTAKAATRSSTSRSAVTTRSNPAGT